MNRLSRIVLASAAVLLSSCVSYQKPLARGAKFDASSGYVLGRLQRPEKGLNLREISLVLTGPGGKKINLSFEADDPLYAVALPPGSYRLTHFALAKGGAVRMPGDYTEEELEQTAFSNPFQLAAGDAVYIGDWAGAMDVGLASTRGLLAPPADRFAATTREFLAANPEFASAKLRSSAARR